jgi:hypothetical protein
MSVFIVAGVYFVVERLLPQFCKIYSNCVYGCAAMKNSIQSNNYQIKHVDF